MPPLNDNEVLKVSYNVDEDRVFHIKIRSNGMPDDFFRVWTYLCFGKYILNN